MGQQPSRRTVLRALGSAGLLGLAGCGEANDAGTDGDGDTLGGSMTIFHAGSLAPPFGAAEPDFEAETGVDVTREAQGSVASTQKLTQQRRSADVLGVSDFRLLRDWVLPDFADWYAIFTTNAVAIQYRPDAPGAAEVGTDNWWEILSRDGVRIGHADPAVDPGGYRAVMAQHLGTEPFRGERLYDEATYRKLRANSTVSTDTETNLSAQLAAGSLDYAFYYRSIAESSDMPAIDLQPAIDLSRATAEYADHYATAVVETDSGTFTGAPIAYGITVPSSAENPAAGARWVEHFATEPGRAVLGDVGLSPVDPVVVPAATAEAVPERVRAVATTQETLGPLQI